VTNAGFPFNPPLHGGTETDPVLEELGSILFDCLRLKRASIEATAYILDAIRAHVLETGLSEGLALRTNRSLQPWQEFLATGLLLSPTSNRPAIAIVAQACGLTATQFSRAFKAQFGQTPQRWRLAAQIERAKSMMTETSYSLTDIAVECGFAEQSHFNHTFRKRVGCAPSTWRKQHASTDSVPDALDGTPA